jgi:hypothetical protein
VHEGTDDLKRPKDVAVGKEKLATYPRLPHLAASCRNAPRHSSQHRHALPQKEKTERQNHKKLTQKEKTERQNHKKLPQKEKTERQNHKKLPQKVKTERQNHKKLPQKVKTEKERTPSCGHPVSRG